MERVYYEIKMADGSIWFASSMVIGTPAKTLATVRRQAARSVPPTANSLTKENDHETKA